MFLPSFPSFDDFCFLATPRLLHRRKTSSICLFVSIVWKVLAGPWMLCWIAQFKHRLWNKNNWKKSRMNPTIRIATLYRIFIQSCQRLDEFLLPSKFSTQSWTSTQACKHFSSGEILCSHPRLETTQRRLGDFSQPFVWSLGLCNAMHNIHVSNE